MATNNKIVVGQGVAHKVAHLMGVSPEMVYMSLAYKRNSKTAERIRHLAVKDFGGVEVQLQQIK